MSDYEDQRTLMKGAVLDILRKKKTSAPTPTYIPADNEKESNPDSNEEWGMPELGVERHGVDYTGREPITEEPMPKISTVDFANYKPVSQTREEIVFENGKGDRIIVKNWFGRMIVERTIWK